MWPLVDCEPFALLLEWNNTCSSLLDDPSSFDEDAFSLSLEDKPLLLVLLDRMVVEVWLALFRLAPLLLLLLLERFFIELVRLLSRSKTSILLEVSFILPRAIVCDFRLLASFSFDGGDGLLGGNVLGDVMVFPFSEFISDWQPIDVDDLLLLLLLLLAPLVVLCRIVLLDVLLSLGYK